MQILWLQVRDAQAFWSSNNVTTGCDCWTTDSDFTLYLLDDGLPLGQSFLVTLLFLPIRRSIFSLDYILYVFNFLLGFIVHSEDIDLSLGRVCTLSF